jgi:hypothetical protein
MKSSLVTVLVRGFVAPLATMGIVGMLVLSACSKQSEGQRCDRRFDNTTSAESDCSTGLSCRTAADLGGTIPGCDVGDLSCGVCCPPSGGTGSCAGQSSADGGVNMGIPDSSTLPEASTPDASRVDASGMDAALPKDASTDTAAPIDANPPTPDATPDASVDDGGSDASDAN